MTETLVDTTIGSGGGTATGSCAFPIEHGGLSLHVSGDGDASNLDFDVTGVARRFDDTVQPANHSESVTGVDASSSDQVVIIHGLEGVERVEVQVTNQNSADSDVTVTQRD